MHLFCTGLSQSLRGCAERGGRGGDVVDQSDVCAFEQMCCQGRGNECTAHVVDARIARQRGLHSGVFDAQQEIVIQAWVIGKERLCPCTGLVEAALFLAFGVEGDGDDPV